MLISAFMQEYIRETDVHILINWPVNSRKTCGASDGQVSLFVELTFSLFVGKKIHKYILDSTVYRETKLRQWRLIITA